MTNLKNILLLGVAGLGMASAQGSAANPVKIVSSTMVVNQVTENGKVTEKLTDGTRALPGQTLEMRQNIQNTTKTAFSKLSLHQLISGGVTYQSNQCDVSGVTTTYSTDPVRLDPKTGAWLNARDMSYSDKPTKTVTVKENGVDVKKTVAATAADYTALRWNLPGLKAEQNVNCSMRVKVK